jgi:septal ring factor EnvC (AmiA/AmiB activator)
MLKRPLEQTDDGRRRYSDASLRDIRTGLAAQIGTLDQRIAAVQRELKEAVALRKELQHDLDYIERRLAGENPDALMAQRRAEAGARRARKDRE